ncbi:hypothetical protein LZ31DRAFT_269222 [Colletotrichum somersetense]|nr:hypothetical protein LZ31DRAFT_269222 [Colletotrichum somersetense]
MDVPRSFVEGFQGAYKEPRCPSSIQLFCNASFPPKQKPQQTPLSKTLFIDISGASVLLVASHPPHRKLPYHGFGHSPRSTSLTPRVCVSVGYPAPLPRHIKSSPVPIRRCESVSFVSKLAATALICQQVTHKHATSRNHKDAKNIFPFQT